MSDKKFTYDDLKTLVDVPRETFLKLEDYVALLRKWQKQINLISNTTLDDVWTRHIVDSAQLINHIEKTDRVIDVGSGAGFPGVVLTILGVENITMVESDSRKVAFLREAARVSKINVAVLNKRIEEVPVDNFDVVTARAFASLRDIFWAFEGRLMVRHKMLLLKGKSCDMEIKQAKENWSFDYEKFRSITDPEGTVLLVKNIIKTVG